MPGITANPIQFEKKRLSKEKIYINGKTMSRLKISTALFHVSNGNNLTWPSPMRQEKIVMRMAGNTKTFPGDETCWNQLNVNFDLPKSYQLELITGRDFPE